MPDTLRDPVHGAIQIDELERHLILSRPVQRLKGIKQLGLVETVYPGASHSRFEHSIGTMYMAGRMAEHLGLSGEEVRKVRLAGLLHDLGHSALSHAWRAFFAETRTYSPPWQAGVFPDTRSSPARS
jgi:HD superfamily phosphohydrolase